jgi:hypothetical protein
MKTTMTKKQRQELVRLEKQILKTARYVEGHGLVKPMSSWDGTTREEVAELLKERQARLNEMFLCTEQEVSDFKKVNDRLYALTQKMHEKALSLYRDILKEGYDRDFDDDIMVEGTVKYVFNDAWGSVVLTGEERRNMYEKHFEPYWSDFPAMLSILFEHYENTLEPECASCFASYELFHKPDMDPKEFGLENGRGIDLIRWGFFYNTDRLRQIAEHSRYLFEKYDKDNPVPVTTENLAAKNAGSGIPCTDDSYTSYFREGHEYFPIFQGTLNENPKLHGNSANTNTSNTPSWPIRPVTSLN